MDAEGRVALVTGAGSGIGRAVALGMLEAGYRVVLSGRRAEPLEETAAMAGADGMRAIVQTADVSDATSVAVLFDRILDEAGRLDVLFNNAGVFPPAASFDDIKLADWKGTIDINLNGAFLVAQAAFRMMKAQQPKGGRIINNGSLSAYVPRPRSAPYSTTKHAITGLTRSIALDGRDHDIACSQIDIGNADTQLVANMGASASPAAAHGNPEPKLDLRHVTDAVRYMAGLPLEANVLFMTVMATKMPFVGRG